MCYLWVLSCWYCWVVARETIGRHKANCIYRKMLANPCAGDIKYYPRLESLSLSLHMYPIALVRLKGCQHCFHYNLPPSPNFSLLPYIWTSYPKEKAHTRDCSTPCLEVIKTQTSWPPFHFPTSYPPTPTSRCSRSSGGGEEEGSFDLAGWGLCQVRWES